MDICLILSFSFDTPFPYFLTNLNVNQERFYLIVALNTKIDITLCLTAPC